MTPNELFDRDSEVIVKWIVRGVWIGVVMAVGYLIYLIVKVYNHYLTT